MRIRTAARITSCWGAPRSGSIAGSAAWTSTFREKTQMNGSRFDRSRFGVWTGCDADSIRNWETSKVIGNVKATLCTTRSRFQLLRRSFYPTAPQQREVISIRCCPATGRLYSEFELGNGFSLRRQCELRYQGSERATAMPRTSFGYLPETAQ